MTDIKPITDEELAWLKNKLDKYIEEYGDDDEIQFGVAQIYPAISRIEADRERIAKVISIAGADPGDIDGAILMLKERQRQIGLQSQDLGQLRKRVKELEKQCADYKDFIDGGIALQHDLERDVFERDKCIAELEERCADLESGVEIWTDTANQAIRNVEYYRGIVVEIGSQFPEAFVCDDGSISDRVLCAKVTDITRNYKAEVERLREIERKYNSGQVMHCEVNDCQIKRGQNAQLSIHVESTNVNPDFARIIDHADRCKVRVIFEINESEPTDAE